VDDKGRVIIPLRFRNELGNTFVITKGLGGCLFIYRDNDFREMEEKLLTQPALNPHTIRLQRWFSAEALETQVDNQGRVAIPPTCAISPAFRKTSPSWARATGSRCGASRAGTPLTRA
jgi:MraZ protein